MRAGGRVRFVHGVTAEPRPAPTRTAEPRGLARWAAYQRERFPVLAHGPLILAFSSGAVCFSALLRARDTASAGRPSVAPASLVVAFVSCFLFFFQLRVSDEVKDFREDARHRPYRPVPRRLVSLRELQILALVGVAFQLAGAVSLSPRLVAPLALVWAFIGLMTKEFWLRAWLAERPVTVLWTHMLVLPLIDLYATACDWLPADGARDVGPGIAWFLAASFCNGMVVEIGRKLRAPPDEERGVRTYTALWGPRRAVTTWLAVMAATALCATAAAAHVGAARLVAALLGAIGLAAVLLGTRLVASPAAGAGRRLETLAGVWTIALYLGVGVIPFVARR